MSNNESCRACFVVNKELVNIFSIYGDVEITYLLKFCVGIEIELEDPGSHVSINHFKNSRNKLYKPLNSR